MSGVKVELLLHERVVVGVIDLDEELVLGQGQVVDPHLLQRFEATHGD